MNMEIVSLTLPLVGKDAAPAWLLLMAGLVFAAVGAISAIILIRKNKK